MKLTQSLASDELSNDLRVPNSERLWINAWISKVAHSRSGHYKLREEIAAHGSRVPFAFFRDTLKYLHSAGSARNTHRHLPSELAQHEQFYWLGIRDWKHRNGLTKYDRESVTLLQLASQARKKLDSATRALVQASTEPEPKSAELADLD
jgi:hypothetical protein